MKKKTDFASSEVGKDLKTIEDLIEETESQYFDETTSSGIKTFPFNSTVSNKPKFADQMRVAEWLDG